MTKEQAIQLINNALASLKLTRQEHEVLVKALNTLIDTKV